MIERLRLWPADALQRLRRTAPGPAAVRSLAAASAFLALLVSLPVAVSLGGRSWLAVSVALVLAMGVGLHPRGRWAGIVALASVAAWIVTSVGYGEAGSLPRVGAVAGLLYTMHAASAFAAVLPYDCVVPTATLRRWLLRQGRFLFAGLVVGLGGLWLVRLVGATPTVAGPVLGALIAAALAGVLAIQRLDPAGPEARATAPADRPTESG
jgi:hypothetical protein